MCHIYTCFIVWVADVWQLLIGCLVKHIFSLFYQSARHQLTTEPQSEQTLVPLFSLSSYDYADSTYQIDIIEFELLDLFSLCSYNYGRYPVVIYVSIMCMEIYFTPQNMPSSLYPRNFIIHNGVCLYMYMYLQACVYT